MPIPSHCQGLHEFLKGMHFWPEERITRTQIFAQQGGEMLLFPVGCHAAPHVTEGAELCISPPTAFLCVRIKKRIPHTEPQSTQRLKVKFGHRCADL